MSLACVSSARHSGRSVSAVVERGIVGAVVMRVVPKGRLVLRPLTLQHTLNCEQPTPGRAGLLRHALLPAVV